MASALCRSFSWVNNNSSSNTRAVVAAPGVRDRAEREGAGAAGDRLVAVIIIVTLTLWILSEVGERTTEAQYDKCFHVGGKSHSVLVETCRNRQQWCPLPSSGLAKKEGHGAAFAVGLPFWLLLFAFPLSQLRRW